MVRVLKVLLAILVFTAGVTGFVILNPLIKDIKPCIVSFLVMTVAAVGCILVPFGLSIYLIERRKGEQKGKK